MLMKRLGFNSSQIVVGLARRHEIRWWTPSRSAVLILAALALTVYDFIAESQQNIDDAQLAGWCLLLPTEPRPELHQLSAAEVAAVPGIGNNLANRIVAFERFFGPLDASQLRLVPGLSPRHLASLRVHVRIREP